MTPQQLLAVRPLDQPIGQCERAHFKIESQCFALFPRSHDLSHDLFQDGLDCLRVSQAHGSDRRECDKLNTILEEVIDLVPIDLVKATHSFFTCLVYCNLPIHGIQKIVIDDQKYGRDPQSI